MHQDAAVPPPFAGAILVETHAHTAEVSACSHLPARHLVALLAQNGYGAAVITDHYLAGKTDTDAQRRAFASGYERAWEAGAAMGVTVLPGMELRFADCGFEDYLVFLPDPWLLYKLKDIARMTPEAFRQVADAEGLLVYQAHPFRIGLAPAPFSLLDGMEVYNGNPNHQNCNQRALAYAQRRGLRQIAGSDLHEAAGVRRGGIWAPPTALTPAGFVRYLRQTSHPALFTPPESDDTCEEEVIS
ncbi:MAG: PHP domain-containing protein [Oscillospiraceae bacterium]|jgi:predicted metal-dependent phosphoesterase TrpH|nr:PHP domain-containing protein [Oscillospiraceae bacterium]